MLPIDPWLVGKFDLIRDIPSFDAALSDPESGAKLMAYLQDPGPWAPPQGITSQDHDADGVRVHIFRPSLAAPASPALLWMHGGGFVIGSVDDTESTVPGYELAARAGAIVVSVGYRLAVDGIRYPAPLDDVLTAWHWLVTQAVGLGADPARLFIGGASVGANLALGASVRLRDSGEPPPRGMLLAYPLAHFPTPAVSADLATELEQVPAMLRFPAEYQLGIVHNYLGRVDDLPADVVPGNHSVAGLPEAWIAPAEYDDLRPSGELLAAQLTAAGVPAHLELGRGMVHGYLGRTPALAPVADSLDFLAAALRS
jgi:acetyl esterase/lipase